MCQANSSGANIFVVTVEPGIFAAANTALLKAAEVAPGWGVHPARTSRWFKATSWMFLMLRY